MKSLKPLGLVLVLLALALALTACSGEPPDEFIENAIAEDTDFIGRTAVADYDVVNHYTEESNGRTYHAYEYEAKVVFTEDAGVFGSEGQKSNETGTVWLVKKGDSWYKVQW